MSTKIKSLMSSTVLAGSLILSAAPVMAREYWHWYEKDHRWEHRADLRSDQRDLAQARRQLEYDRAHHASRRTIAQDEARIRDIERDIRADLHAQR
jgi:DNA-binding FadR family transcriptional regulator